MTNLSKTLSHLPDNKVRELEMVTQRIVDTGRTEIVILFGSYARGDYKEQRGKTRGKKSDYDILAVTADADSRKELSIKLREIFKGIGITIQLIVEQISFVNSNLEEKQYFFSDIKREGKVLFHSGNFELADPKEPTPARRREISEVDFRNWYSKAEDFWRHFQYDLKDNAYQMASFSLQQVVEICYTTIEMVFTHYNPYEHNLEVLRDRALFFDSRVKTVLPYETEDQQELFDYLNFAYIGGRYRSSEEFPVTKAQLDYWDKEIKKLLDLTAKICKERIECLKKIEHKS